MAVVSQMLVNATDVPFSRLQECSQCWRA